MRGGCEGKSRDDGGAKHASRSRSSPSRESGETRKPTSDLAVDADLHSLGFFLFFFPCAPSRHRVFTVIKSVIKAAFVCFVFHLRGVSVDAADWMYKEVHVFLCVHPYIVYAYHRVRVCICPPARPV